MKMCNSNTAIDVYRHYLIILSDEYDEREANAMLNILFESYTGYRKVMLAADSSIRLSESQLLDIHFGVKDLLRNIPIQYIVGETDFMGIRIMVDKNVLIPRPETEELVKWITDDMAKRKALKVLDIGTGSGCIAIALSQRLDSACVCGVDISEGAIATAKRNADINDANVKLMVCDILTDMPNVGHGYDLIVSNPPYIGLSEHRLMKPNVLNNEPHAALFVPDDDVLLFYRHICNHAISHGLLNNEGVIYFEINEMYGNELKKMASDMGFWCEIRKDINGKDRMAKLSFKI